MIVSREMTAIEAMKASWSETKGSQGPLLIVFIGYTGLYIGALLLGIGLVRWTGARPDSLFLAVPAGFLSNVVTVGGWLLSVAAYNALVSDKGLRAVFS
jgi:hypothetical protein